jgi:hypothetical protein
VKFCMEFDHKYTMSLKFVNQFYVLTVTNMIMIRNFVFNLMYMEYVIAESMFTNEINSKHKIFALVTKVYIFVIQKVFRSVRRMFQCATHVNECFLDQRKARLLVVLRETAPQFNVNVLVCLASSLLTNRYSYGPRLKKFL